MASTLNNIAAVLFVYVTVLGVETSADNFKLMILHTNDMHSRFFEVNKLAGVCAPEDKKKNECYGGFARVSEAVTTARRKNDKDNKQTLFLIAGDIYQGTILYTIYKWKIVARLTNMLKPDVMSLGNHEFDDGVKGLIPFIDNVTFPVLASNLDLTKQPDLRRPNLKNSTVINRNGVKIAIIGYVTPDTKFVSQAGDVEFLDEVSSINAEIERLKAVHPDLRIFIALGHSGFEMDKKIAAGVPDIDAVIGGHTNTFLYTGKQPDNEVPEGLYPTMVKQKSGRQVPVVQAYAYTKYLGQLKLEFDSLGEVKEVKGSPLLLDYKIDHDPFILQELNRWEKNVSLQASEELGTTKTLLDGDSTHCRVQECNLGNLLTDAYIDYMARLHRLNEGKGWTDTPIAIQHSGGIRSSIDAQNKQGKVTLGDILSVLPFVNNMVKMNLKGSDLLEVLEWSVHDFNPTERKGKFLQYSGLKVEYDLKKHNGKRVTKALARCGECRVPMYRPVDVKEIYSVIMPVFVAIGGDDYKVLKKNYRRNQEMDTTDTDMMKEYLQRRSPVYPGLEGRIKFVDGATRSAASKVTPFVSLALLISIAIALRTM